MLIKVKNIKIDDKKRIRFESGKNIRDLKESIKHIGLLHPLTLDNKLNLIAGFRRFRAIKELEWDEVEVNILGNLNKLEKFDIELDENWRRKDLTNYEIDLALARRKMIYEELHPETKRGAYMKEHREEGLDKLLKRSINDTVSVIEPAKAFTKETAEKLDVSERTIYRSVHVGEAILKKEVPKEVEEKYKKDLISKKEIIETIRNLRKEAKKHASKKPKKKEEIKQKKVEPMELPKEVEVVNFCKHCSDVRATACPYCGHKVYKCNKTDIFVIFTEEKEACDKYNE